MNVDIKYDYINKQGNETQLSEFIFNSNTTLTPDPTGVNISISMILSDKFLSIPKSY